jgi:rubrerythrin
MTNLTKSLSAGTQDILDVCREIRLVCAELHHYYADLFVNDRAALLFWKRIAMGEENHAKEFDLIAKLRRQNLVHSFRSDLLDAEIALIYLRSLIERTKQNPPSLAEALRTSIKLEEKLSPFHLQNIVKFVDSSFRKQFTGLIQAEQERIASLRKAYEKLLAPASDNSFQCDLTI